MTNGRPLQYDPDKALDAAMQLFWSKGYEATSMQDLLTAMGLSKSSLYQGFGGKKELFIRCLERYRSHMYEVFAGLLDKSDSGLKFIETVLLSSARNPDHLRRGCLLMNTATEFAQKDQQVAEHVTIGFKGLRKALKVAVQRGQQDGSIRSNQDAGILANYLSCTLGGIKTVVKGGADEKTVKEIVGVILKALA
ncbi:MAG: TetR/AcrR family transcriptional regulator [Desulfuromonadaceae bacterium]|nr:TetR/AcrR family transcriptional regulator [Desulfuromonadaceae bacterium]